MYLKQIILLFTIVSFTLSPIAPVFAEEPVSESTASVNKTSGTFYCERIQLNPGSSPK